LDVGCGPGQWAFAAAKANPEATVIGIDINEILLDSAIKYKIENDIKNCEFFRESYENLLKIFQPESFDVIMCNSVLQYIDEKRAFQIFAHLLEKGGILIMFWNPGPGYYLERLVSGIKNRNRREITSALYSFRFRKARPEREHCLTFEYLKRRAKVFGITLFQIATEPKLDYRDRYFGIPYVFSCKGYKTVSQSHKVMVCVE